MFKIDFIDRFSHIFSKKILIQFIYIFIHLYMNVSIIIINEKIFTFHHTIRQTYLTCLHLSVSTLQYLVPYNRKFNEDKLKNLKNRFR